MTKYPSILTYHEMGNKGSLNSTLTGDGSFKRDTGYYVTEKIDGTNSRIIVCGDDFILGSREHLLYARGDRFGDPAQHIVETVKSYAEIIINKIKDASGLYVFYGETYGGNITAASREYTKDQTYSFRLFDFISIPFKNLEDILKKPVQELSCWREGDHGYFGSVDDLKKMAEDIGIPRVPPLAVVPGNEIPDDPPDTYQWLQQYRKTEAGINAEGNAEGVVIRTRDRSIIRKLRFEDYERTRKRNNW